MATAIREKKVAKSKMNVLILYQDCNQAAKANAVLERASDGLGWNVTPWRLDMLACRPLAQQALKDATDAHLIMIALGGVHQFPRGLFYWLESWAERRRVRDAGVAIFEGCADTVRDPSPASLFGGFAERHGLELIVDELDSEIPFKNGGGLSPWILDETRPPGCRR